MNTDKTQASLFYFQNPNSGCPMILRRHYRKYCVVCDPARDDEPAEQDQADADEYSVVVAKAQDDDHAVFSLRTALGLDADGDVR